MLNAKEKAMAAEREKFAKEIPKRVLNEIPIMLELLGVIFNKLSEQKNGVKLSSEECKMLSSILKRIAVMLEAIARLLIATNTEDKSQKSGQKSNVKVKCKSQNT